MKLFAAMIMTLGLMASSAVMACGCDSGDCPAKTGVLASTP